MADIFNTRRRKRKAIREKNTKTDNSSELQKKLNEANVIQLKQLNPSQHGFKTLKLELKEWVVPKRGLPDEQGEIDPQYFSWELELERFDIRYLPYVTVDFVIKAVSVQNIAHLDYPIEFIAKGVYFSVSDIEGLDERRSKNIKKVKILLSLYISSVIFYNSEFGENDFDSLDNLYEFYPVVAIPSPTLYT